MSGVVLIAGLGTNRWGSTHSAAGFNLSVFLAVARQCRVGLVSSASGHLGDVGNHEIGRVISNFFLRDRGRQGIVGSLDVPCDS